LSWQVHAGLTGVANLKPETFVFMCAQAYELSSRVFQEILKVVMNEFRLTATNPQLAEKMAFAKLLPFTQGAEDEDKLRREVGL
jgi:hypothetical protein